MVTISVRLTIAIPYAESLKDKRAVVLSLVQRLRERRRIAAAEVGMQDHVRMGQVGFAVVSGERATAREQVEAARRFVDDELIGKAEVIDAAQEEWTLE
jgi:uncharacterized protein YlxP (DUF503 family)